MFPGAVRDLVEQCATGKLQSCLVKQSVAFLIFVALCVARRRRLQQQGRPLRTDVFAVLSGSQRADAGCVHCVHCMQRITVARTCYLNGLLPTAGASRPEADEECMCRDAQTCAEMQKDVRRHQ